MNSESKLVITDPEAEVTIKTKEEELKELQAQYEFFHAKWKAYHARAPEFYDELMFKIYEDAVKHSGRDTEYRRLLIEHPRIVPGQSPYSYDEVMTNFEKFKEFTMYLNTESRKDLDPLKGRITKLMAEIKEEADIVSDIEKEEAFEKQKNRLYEEVFDFLSKIEEILPEEAKQAGLSQSVAVNMYFGHFGAEFYNEVASLLRDIGNLEDLTNHIKFNELEKCKSRFTELENSRYGMDLGLLLKK